MKTSSLLNDLVYKENKPNIQLLLETENTKEIRISMDKGQIMKEHKSPYPIVVEIFEGEIDFTVYGKKHRFTKGDMLSLEGNVLHELYGVEKSIIRLSISKSDTFNRVIGVVRD